MSDLHLCLVMILVDEPEYCIWLDNPYNEAGTKHSHVWTIVIVGNLKGGGFLRFGLVALT